MRKSVNLSMWSISVFVAHYDVISWNCVPHYSCFVRGIAQRASTVELWRTFCLPEQAVEQTIALSVIWDFLALMWRQLMNGSGLELRIWNGSSYFEFVFPNHFACIQQLLNPEKNSLKNSELSTKISRDNTGIANFKDNEIYLNMI